MNFFTKLKENFQTRLNDLKFNVGDESSNVKIRRFSSCGLGKIRCNVLCTGGFLDKEQNPNCLAFAREYPKAPPKNCYLAEPTEENKYQ